MIRLPEIVVDEPHHNSCEVPYRELVSMVYEMYTVVVCPRLAAVPQPECYFRVVLKAFRHQIGIAASGCVVCSIRSGPKGWDCNYFHPGVEKVLCQAAHPISKLFWRAEGGQIIPTNHEDCHP